MLKKKTYMQTAPLIFTTLLIILQQTYVEGRIFFGQESRLNPGGLHRHEHEQHREAFRRPPVEYEEQYEAQPFRAANPPVSMRASSRRSSPPFSSQADERFLNEREEALQRKQRAADTKLGGIVMFGFFDLYGSLSNVGKAVTILSNQLWRGLEAAVIRWMLPDSPASPAELRSEARTSVIIVSWTIIATVVIFGSLFVKRCCCDRIFAEYADDDADSLLGEDDVDADEGDLSAEAALSPQTISSRNFEAQKIKHLKEEEELKQLEQQKKNQQHSAFKRFDPAVIPLARLERKISSAEGVRESSDSSQFASVRWVNRCLENIHRRPDVRHRILQKWMQALNEYIANKISAKKGGVSVEFVEVSFSSPPVVDNVRVSVFKSSSEQKKLNVICDFQVSSLQFGLHVINNQTSKTENDKNNGQPPRDNHVDEGSKKHVALTYEYLLSVEQLKAQIRGEVDDGEDQTKKNLVKLSWNRGFEPELKLNPTMRASNASASRIPPTSTSPASTTLETLQGELVQKMAAEAIICCGEISLDQEEDLCLQKYDLSRKRRFSRKRPSNLMASEDIILAVPGHLTSALCLEIDRLRVTIRRAVGLPSNTKPYITMAIDRPDQLLETLRLPKMIRTRHTAPNIKSTPSSMGSNMSDLMPLVPVTSTLQQHGTFVWNQTFEFVVLPSLSRQILIQLWTSKEEEQVVRGEHRFISDTLTSSMVFSLNGLKSPLHQRHTVQLFDQNFPNEGGYNNNYCNESNQHLDDVGLTMSSQPSHDSSPLRDDEKSFTKSHQSSLIVEFKYIPAEQSYQAFDNDSAVQLFTERQRVSDPLGNAVNTKKKTYKLCQKFLPTCPPEVRSSQRIGSNSTKREATATASFRNRKSLLRRRKSSRRRKENNRKLSETSSQYNNNCKDDNANEEGEDSDSMQDEDASKNFVAEMALRDLGKDRMISTLTAGKKPIRTTMVITSVHKTFRRKSMFVSTPDVAVRQTASADNSPKAENGKTNGNNNSSTNTDAEATSNSNVDALLTDHSDVKKKGRFSMSRLRKKFKNKHKSDNALDRYKISENEEIRSRAKSFILNPNNQIETNCDNPTTIITPENYIDSSDEDDEEDLSKNSDEEYTGLTFSPRGSKKSSEGRPRSDSGVEVEAILGTWKGAPLSASWLSLRGENFDRVGGGRNSLTIPSYSAASFSQYHQGIPGSGLGDDATSLSEVSAVSSSSIGGINSPRNEEENSNKERSALILEIQESEGLFTRHYLIPPQLARKSRLKRLGLKLHAYLDHLFQAKHIKGGSQCDVCNKRIIKRLGKQGYECRNCGLICHKSCHLKVEKLCAKPGLADIDLLRGSTLMSVLKKQSSK